MFPQRLWQAIVEEGDIISINITEGKLDVLLEESELKDRLEKWTAPEPKISKGYLGRYARMVTSANTGAILG